MVKVQSLQSTKHFQDRLSILSFILSQMKADVLSIYQKCSALCKVKSPKNTDKPLENTLIMTSTMTWGTTSCEARDNSASVWVHTWDLPDRKWLNSANCNLVVRFQDTNYCLLGSKSYKWILFAVQVW